MAEFLQGFPPGAIFQSSLAPRNVFCSREEMPTKSPRNGRNMGEIGAESASGDLRNQCSVELTHLLRARPPDVS